MLTAFLCAIILALATIILALEQERSYFRYRAEAAEARAVEAEKAAELRLLNNAKLMSRLGEAQTRLEECGGATGRSDIEEVFNRR